MRVDPRRRRDWPVILRTLATSALHVGTMTYVAMPVMTRLFDR